MDHPTPRFFEHKNKVLAHLEWEAIRYIPVSYTHLTLPTNGEV